MMFDTKHNDNHIIDARGHGQKCPFTFILKVGVVFTMLRDKQYCLQFLFFIFYFFFFFFFFVEMAPQFQANDIPVLTCLIYEPVREKTNNLGSYQVRHKPACTVTEDG